jgi:hypothetical protein
MTAIQRFEKIFVHTNDGKGNFTTKLIYESAKSDFGSSGIFMCDLDKDGDQDILYTNGDVFGSVPRTGGSWHGVQWLENKGKLEFEYHRICDFNGAYNARPVDIDGDGDLDIFAVSAYNQWENSESQSFIWLENTGDMKFKMYDIASSPTHLMALATGDFNNDGLADMVTGGMYMYPPYDRMSRIVLWINNGKLITKK